MSSVDPPLGGANAVSERWISSMCYALVTAGLVAIPGFILYSPSSRFSRKLWPPDISTALFDRDFANYWMGARMVLEGQHQDLWAQGACWHSPWTVMRAVPG